MSIDSGPPDSVDFLEKRHLMRSIVFACALVLLAAFPVFAGEPVACGVPDPAVLDTEIPDYCNFHDRRFAYRDEDKKFKNLIEERRKNYNAPREQALKAYKADLEKRYNEIGRKESPAESIDAAEGNVGNE